MKTSIVYCVVSDDKDICIGKPHGIAVAISFPWQNLGYCRI